MWKASKDSGWTLVSPRHSKRSRAAVTAKPDAIEIANSNAEACTASIERMVTAKMDFFEIAEISNALIAQAKRARGSNINNNNIISNNNNNETTAGITDAKGAADGEGTEDSDGVAIEDADAHNATAVGIPAVDHANGDSDADVMRHTVNDEDSPNSMNTDSTVDINIIINNIITNNVVCEGSNATADANAATATSNAVIVETATHDTNNGPPAPVTPEDAQARTTSATNASAAPVAIAEPVDPVVDAAIPTADITNDVCGSNNNIINTNNNNNNGPARATASIEIDINITNITNIDVCGVPKPIIFV